MRIFGLCLLLTISVTTLAKTLVPRGAKENYHSLSNGGEVEEESEAQTSVSPLKIPKINTQGTQCYDVPSSKRSSEDERPFAQHSLQYKYKRRRSPYGIVYNQGKPIGILEPISHVYEFQNVQQDAEIDAKVPTKRDSEEFLGYPNTLTNFKIGTRLLNAKPLVSVEDTDYAPQELKAWKKRGASSEHSEDLPEGKKWEKRSVDGKLFGGPQDFEIREKSEEEPGLRKKWAKRSADVVKEKRDLTDNNFENLSQIEENLKQIMNDLGLIREEDRKVLKKRDIGMKQKDLHIVKNEFRNSRITKREAVKTLDGTISKREDTKDGDAKLKITESVKEEGVKITKRDASKVEDAKITKTDYAKVEDANNANAGAGKVGDSTIIKRDVAKSMDNKINTLQVVNLVDSKSAKREVKLKDSVTSKDVEISKQETPKVATSEGIASTAKISKREAQKEVTFKDLAGEGIAHPKVIKRAVAEVTENSLKDGGDKKEQLNVLKRDADDEEKKEPLNQLKIVKDGGEKKQHVSKRETLLDGRGNEHLDVLKSVDTIDSGEKQETKRDAKTEREAKEAAKAIAEDEDLETGANKIGIAKELHSSASGGKKNLRKGAVLSMPNEDLRIQQESLKKNDAMIHSLKNNEDTVEYQDGSLNRNDATIHSLKSNEDTFEESEGPMKENTAIEEENEDKILDYHVEGERFIRRKRQQQQSKNNNNNSNNAENNDLMKGLETSGDLTVSGNKSPLASSSTASLDAEGKQKVLKERNEKRAEDLEYEKRLQRNIREKLMKIKEDVKREISTLKKGNNKVKREESTEDDKNNAVDEKREKRGSEIKKKKSTEVEESSELKKEDVGDEKVNNREDSVVQVKKRSTAEFGEEKFENKEKRGLEMKKKDVESNQDKMESRENRRDEIKKQNAEVGEEKTNSREKRELNNKNNEITKVGEGKAERRERREVEIKNNLNGIEDDKIAMKKENGEFGHETLSGREKRGAELKKENREDDEKATAEEEKRETGKIERQVGQKRDKRNLLEKENELFTPARNIEEPQEVHVRKRRDLNFEDFVEEESNVDQVKNHDLSYQDFQGDNGEVKKRDLSNEDLQSNIDVNYDDLQAVQKRDLNYEDSDDEKISWRELEEDEDNKYGADVNKRESRDDYADFENSAAEFDDANRAEQVESRLKRRDDFKVISEVKSGEEHIQKFPGMTRDYAEEENAEKRDFNAKSDEALEKRDSGAKYNEALEKRSNSVKLDESLEKNDNSAKFYDAMDKRQNSVNYGEDLEKRDNSAEYGEVLEKRDNSGRFEDAMEKKAIKSGTENREEDSRSDFWDAQNRNVVKMSPDRQAIRAVARRDSQAPSVPVAYKNNAAKRGAEQISNIEVELHTGGGDRARTTHAKREKQQDDRIDSVETLSNDAEEEFKRSKREDTGKATTGGVGFQVFELPENVNVGLKKDDGKDKRNAATAKKINKRDITQQNQHSNNEKLKDEKKRASNEENKKDTNINKRDAIEKLDAKNSNSKDVTKRASTESTTIKNEDKSSANIQDVKKRKSTEENKSGSNSKEENKRATIEDNSKKIEDMVGINLKDVKKRASTENNLKRAVKDENMRASTEDGKRVSGDAKSQKEEKRAFASESTINQASKDDKETKDEKKRDSKLINKRSDVEARSDLVSSEEARTNNGALRLGRSSGNLSPEISLEDMQRLDSENNSKRRKRADDDAVEQFRNYRGDEDEADDESDEFDDDNFDDRTANLIRKRELYEYNDFGDYEEPGVGEKGLSYLRGYVSGLNSDAYGDRNYLYPVGDRRKRDALENQKRRNEEMGERKQDTAVRKRRSESTQNRNPEFWDNEFAKQMKREAFEDDNQRKKRSAFWNDAIARKMSSQGTDNRKNEMSEGFVHEALMRQKRNDDADNQQQEIHDELLPEEVFRQKRSNVLKDEKHMRKRSTFWNDEIAKTKGTEKSEEDVQGMNEIVRKRRSEGINDEDEDMSEFLFNGIGRKKRMEYLHDNKKSQTPLREGSKTIQQKNNVENENEEDAERMKKSVFPNQIVNEAKGTLQKDKDIERKKKSVSYNNFRGATEMKKNSDLNEDNIKSSLSVQESKLNDEIEEDADRKKRSVFTDLVGIHSGGPMLRHLAAARERSLQHMDGNSRMKRLEEEKSKTKKDQGIAGLSEADFGGLPQSYEGELNRFKRVKRFD